MSGSADDVTPNAGEISIDASQLRPGVHVRLPVPWMEHEFMFSSFVIADEEQARLIAAMHLPQLFCDPTRCKVPPLPLRPATSAAEAAVTPEQEAEIARLATLAATHMAQKRERLLAMNELRSELRKRLNNTRRYYLGAAKTVGGALRGFATSAREAMNQFVTVSEESTTALLADPDSAIMLIADMANNDGHAAHALSVMTLALLLGKKAELPEVSLRALAVGALLHDIGKLSINPAILRSSERNRHEATIYRTHCRSGYDEALRAGTVSQAMLEAILSHHERFDGSGFPDHLSGREIPLAARIVAIANRFDNLVNPVDYRHALSPSEALATMWAREKTRFDPGLLGLFVRAMGVYPPGSIVQLSDGRIGAVAGSAPDAKPLSPLVTIYAPEVPRQQAILVDLANDEGLVIERSLRLQHRSPDELDYLLPRRQMKWSYMAAPERASSRVAGAVSAAVAGSDAD